MFKAKCFRFCSKFRRKCNFVKCEKLFTRRSLLDFLKSFWNKLSRCVNSSPLCMYCVELSFSLCWVICADFTFTVEPDLDVSLRLTTLLLHFSLWALLRKNWKADPGSAWDDALIVALGSSSPPPAGTWIHIPFKLVISWRIITKTLSARQLFIPLVYECRFLRSPSLSSLLLHGLLSFPFLHLVFLFTFLCTLSQQTW